MYCWSRKCTRQAAILGFLELCPGSGLQGTLLPFCPLPTHFQHDVPSVQGTALAAETVGDAGGLCVALRCLLMRLCPAGLWEPRPGPCSKRTTQAGAQGTHRSQ